ncbi:MAG TPA: ATP-binding protein [Verrucomicrobiae bacterium]
MQSHLCLRDAAPDGERRAVEEGFNQERALLSALLDHSEDRIYFKDLQSRFLRCSAAQMRAFQAKGLPDVIGKTDHDFFSKEHADDAFRDEQKIIRTGEAVSGKVEKETWPDGRVTWALTGKMPLRDDRGRIVGTFGISKDITAIKDAEAKANALHRQLEEASRQAGMAEVATSVLHNVGNVLNSVNVSGALVAEKVSHSKAASLAKVVALLQAHAEDLPGFFAHDPKGRQLVTYLADLTVRLEEERAEILRELATQSGDIQHIKEIISMQQDTARTVGVTETLPASDMVEDALRLNLGALERHGFKLVREYASTPPITVEKHKVLQILVNLIRNAKYACAESGRPDKQINLRIVNGEATLKISVADNGIGIAPENLTRIFHHGFTTRKDGHGFGLHSGALAAKELGGTLQAFSEGPGKGATFTLELPLNPTKRPDHEIPIEQPYPRN